MATLLGILFLIVCLLLIIVVLLQKGRGGGLGAAFGGGGAGSSAFGTRTGDVFTWVTIVLTGLFLLLAIGAALTYRPEMTPVATPTVDPDHWKVDPSAENQAVTLNCETRGAALHYTVDGSMPTEKSDVASTDGTVLVQPGTILRVIGKRAGRQDSQMLEVVYLLPAPPAPTFKPGAWTGEQMPVEIESTVEGGTIRYTLDGSAPTADSPEYTGPIMVNSGDTLSARVFLDKHEPSTVVSAEYTRPIGGTPTPASAPAETPAETPGVPTPAETPAEPTGVPAPAPMPAVTP